MKINNKKVIVATLALAMGAALAGSISGSVAWYQDSTRAAAQIVGTSAGAAGRLQLKKSADADTAYADYIDLATEAEPEKFRPVSSEDGLNFFDHPVYQFAELPAVETSDKGYVDYNLDFRFQEDKGSGWADTAAKKVYLSHFNIVDKSTTSKDVTPAVRVAFISGGAVKAILGITDEIETITEGQLDLNKNGELDTDFWDCQDLGTRTGENDITYTNGGAGSYKTAKHEDVVLSDTEKESVYPLESVAAADKVLTSTGTTLTVRVWLEGWTELGASAIWTTDYIAQNFSIEMQFQCQANK